jgi:hypothetical protein
LDLEWRIPRGQAEPDSDTIGEVLAEVHVLFGVSEDRLLPPRPVIPRLILRAEGEIHTSETICSY